MGGKCNAGRRAILLQQFHGAHAVGSAAQLGKQRGLWRWAERGLAPARYRPVFCTREPVRPAADPPDAPVPADGNKYVPAPPFWRGTRTVAPFATEFAQSKEGHPRKSVPTICVVQFIICTVQFPLWLTTSVSPCVPAHVPRQTRKVSVSKRVWGPVRGKVPRRGMRRWPDRNEAAPVQALAGGWRSGEAHRRATRASEQAHLSAWAHRHEKLGAPHFTNERGQPFVEQALDRRAAASKGSTAGENSKIEEDVEALKKFAPLFINSKDVVEKYKRSTNLYCETLQNLFFFLMNMTNLRSYYKKIQIRSKSYEYK